MVEDDFDKTEYPLKTPEHYIQDLDIIKIIRHIYECNNWQEWAIRNPKEAAKYITPPYSYLAQAELGYRSQPNLVLPDKNNNVKGSENESSVHQQEKQHGHKAEEEGPNQERQNHAKEAEEPRK